MAATATPSLAVAFAALVGLASAARAPVVMYRGGHSPLDIPTSSVCAMNKLAMQFAHVIQPNRRASWNTATHDALMLTAMFNLTAAVPAPAAGAPRLPGAPPPPLDDAVWVDAALGQDQDQEHRETQTRRPASTSSHGSRGRPFRTVHAAVDAVRRRRRLAGAGANARRRQEIVLKPGVHYFNTTLRLTAADSELTIRSAQAPTGASDRPWISGGVPLRGLRWERKPRNLFVADVSAHLASFKDASFSTLHVNGQRATRARYPNGNVERHREGSVDANPEYATARYYLPPSGGDGYGYSGPKPSYINISEPARLDHYSQFWQMGVGPEGGYASGHTPGAANFVPPAAFYSSRNPKAGGPAFSQYHVTPGLVFNATTFSPRVTRWTRPEEAIVHMFTPYQFALWQFKIRAVNTTNSTLLFGRGGFQEQRGCEQRCGLEWAHASKDSRQFYVENVKEELDAPNEFYLDTKEGKLYYIANSSDFDPGAADFVAPGLQSVIDARGSQADPVVGVALDGVGVTQTAVTEAG